EVIVQADVVTGAPARFEYTHCFSHDRIEGPILDVLEYPIAVDHVHGCRSKPGLRGVTGRHIRDVERTQKCGKRRRPESPQPALKHIASEPGRLRQLPDMASRDIEKLLHEGQSQVRLMIEGVDVLCTKKRKGDAAYALPARADFKNCPAGNPEPCVEAANVVCLNQ